MSCLILSWRGFLTTKKKLEPKFSSLVEFSGDIFIERRGAFQWTSWNYCFGPFGLFFLLGLLICSTVYLYRCFLFTYYKIRLKDENIWLFVTYFLAFFSASMTDKGSPIENDAQEAQLPFSREGDSGYSIVNNIPLPKNDSALNAIGNTDELMCHLG